MAAEISLLKELGRTDLGVPSLKRAFEDTCWRFLPLDMDQIDEFGALTSIRDPFDRLILAAARSVGAKLISRDAVLKDSGLVDVSWA